MVDYGILIREIDGQEGARSEVRRAKGLIAKEFTDWNSILLGLPIESDTPIQAAVLGFVRVVEDAIENTDDREKFLSRMKMDVPEMRQDRFIIGDGCTPNIIELLRQYDTEKVELGAFSLGTEQWDGGEPTDPSDHDDISIEVSFFPVNQDSPTYYHLNIRKTDPDYYTSGRNGKLLDDSEVPSATKEDQKDEFLMPFVRIYDAWFLENKRYQQDPPQPDMLAEHTAVAAWSTVTCCYSGIEQAMKCLLQMRKMYKKDHRDHDVGKLFQALACQDKKTVRESYAIYRSLHDYIPPETADDFLDAIGKGYNSWRYFLLEGSDQNKWPPTTHPGAMLEIWFALCQIMRKERGIDLGVGTVNQDIFQHLEESLFLKAYRCCIPLLERNIRDGEAIGSSELSELDSWFKGYDGNLIDACSDLIHATANGNFDVQCKDLSPTTSAILSVFLENVEGDESYRREEVKYFIRRAKKERIRWDQKARRFVS